MPDLVRPTSLLPASRPIPRLFLVLFAASALTACASSEVTGPEEEGPALGALVGQWEATSMVLTSVNDTNISVDIVQNDKISGAFSLTIQEDGRYVATLTLPASDPPSQDERGSLELSGDTLLFKPDLGPPSEVRWSLTGDTLTLDGESSFDFNNDQEREEATLHLVLVRS